MFGFNKKYGWLVVAICISLIGKCIVWEAEAIKAENVEEALKQLEPEGIEGRKVALCEKPFRTLRKAQKWMGSRECFEAIGREPFNIWD